MNWISLKKIILIAMLGPMLCPLAFAQPENDNQRSAVCVQVNIDTGECERWRPYNEIPANGRVPQGNYSYENDYRLPPPEARVPARPAATIGSGLMPSTNYAPGFGTSHKPVFQKK